MRRSLLQSAPVPRLALEVLPVAPSFMRFGLPRRDDPSLVIVSVRVNHRNFQAVHYANGVHPSNGHRPFRSAPRRSASHPRTQFHATRCCGGSFLHPKYNAFRCIYTMLIRQTSEMLAVPSEQRISAVRHNGFTCSLTLPNYRRPQGSTGVCTLIC